MKLLASVAAAAFLVGTVVAALIMDTRHRQQRATILPADPAMVECLKDLEETRRELSTARTMGCPECPDGG